MSDPEINIRRARTSDVPWILELTKPLVDSRVLLGKDAVSVYEAVQEFRVAEDDAGNRIGCGALHVMWEDLAEIRTLAVEPNWLGKGVGAALLQRLVDDAEDLGLKRLFCLTFEVDFFTRHGFSEVSDSIVDPETYKELVLSHDEGVAEFLDLARVKPNTLGNTRMLRNL